MAKPKHYQHSIQKVSDLIPYAHNSRTHSDEQINQVASSIKEFGFTSPVLIDEQGGIIAGHGRVMAAQKLKLDEVPCITLEGLTEAQRKAYVIADNQLPLNAGWDLDKLKIEIDGLSELDFDINLLGFDDDFLDDLLDDMLGGEDDLQGEGDSPYTQNIEAPTYEPKNEKPETIQLVDYTYHDTLIEKIKRSEVTNEEKAFLLSAAERHSVFNFSAIADYYAHSNGEMQELMEDSALVIIDYNKAIENGFVQISKELTQQCVEASDDE